MSSERVSIADIESKLRGIQGGVTKQLDDKKQSLIAGMGGLGLIFMIIVYLMGRRSGKRKTTLVEIRRS